MADGEDTGPLNIEGQAASGDIHAIRLILDTQLPNIDKAKSRLQEFVRQAENELNKLRNTGAPLADVESQSRQYRDLTKGLADLERQYYSLRTAAERGLSTRDFERTHS